MKLLTDRRSFMIQAAALGAAALSSPGVFAEELTRTPRQTEGPFYPNELPLDTDNDLLILNDSITPAVGQVSHITGKVLSKSGVPVRNAVVEIWQVDSQGVYIHTGSFGRSARDTNFQGFGRFLTGSTGEYYFRTIKPIAYGSRTAHVHFAINQNGRRVLTTQMYEKGDPMNRRDNVIQAIRDPKARESVVVEYKPLPDSESGELTAHFEIVIGVTPEDPEESFLQPDFGARRRRRRGRL